MADRQRQALPAGGGAVACGLASPCSSDRDGWHSARHFDAQYSWNAHVGKAIEAGVSRESLQALAEHKEPGFTRRDEEVAYQFSTEILGEHFVSDATFAAALEEFGEQGVVDLIGSSGTSPCSPCCSTPSRSTCSPSSRRSPTSAVTHASPGEQVLPEM